MKQKKKEEILEDDGSMFGEESFDEQRKVLLQWMRKEKKPNKMHQDLLEMYINDCVKMNRLENVTYILKYIRRFAENEDNDEWMEIAMNLIELTQKEVKLKHKYKLQL